jgi:outer membrane protein assembly factor BamD (BamD/ComL family)
LIDQPNQPTKQIVHFLNLLADLQIKHANDTVVAAQTLQRIIDRYPGSAPAENARRRIALLKLETKADDKSQPIKLGTYEKNLGLKKP